jgi:hypothetical protein
MESKSKNAPKSDTSSPAETNKEEVSYCGGMPPEKDVKAIAKVNSPSGRGKAPGSVRV